MMFHDNVFAGIGIFFGLFLIAVGIAIYFIPSFIAFSRKDRNAVAILVLNLFLGWSLLGWLGSLIWALLDEKQGPTPLTPYPYPYHPHAGAPSNPSAPRASLPPGQLCPNCGQAVAASDQFCGHCGRPLR